MRLQVSAAMPEAWKETWQTAPPAADGQAAAPTTLIKAAQQLGVGVFASGPFVEVSGSRRPYSTCAACATPKCYVQAWCHTIGVHMRVLAV